MIRNTEIKVSLAVLSAILAVFLLYQIITLNAFYDQLRSSYVNVFATIAAELTEKYPESEAAIMKTVTGNSLDSGEALDKGKVLLRQYGVSESLDFELFPILNKMFARNNLFVFSGLLAVIVLILLVSYMQYNYFFIRIRSITLAAKKIIEGDYSIEINEEREGDFSKLADAFRSIRDIIRKKMQDLHEEKIFLVQILQDISHQLKTPLSTIAVYNDMLLNERLSDGQQHLVQINQSQVTRMNILIQNILKVAKIDAKSILFKKESLSLVETVHDVLDNLQAKLQQKNINVSFNADQQTLLLHDPIWIQEALTNIIKNAIEHSEANGEIVIEVNDNPMYAELMIQDFGEGLNPEQLLHIFERFYKGGTSKKESAGIGLALAKAIIDAHNGFIKVESEKNVYTKFTITFMKY